MGNKMTEREFWDALMRLLRALRDAYNQSLQGEDELPRGASRRLPFPPCP